MFSLSSLDVHLYWVPVWVTSKLSGLKQPPALMISEAVVWDFGSSVAVLPQRLS